MTLKFQRKIPRMNAHVLIDIVANHCYLNSTYVMRVGLNVAKRNGLVMLVHGLEVELERTINVHVKIQQYQSQVSCLVTKLSDRLDLILEDKRLKKHKAHIDFEFKACALHKSNKKITMQNGMTNKKASSQDKILLALQFNKAIHSINIRISLNKFSFFEYGI